MNEIYIEMTAKGAGITIQESTFIPYEDGIYSLHEKRYPLCRFNKVIIRGDTIDLDGEISKLTGCTLETTKYYTAYAPDKHPEKESIYIRIYTIHR